MSVALQGCKLVWYWGVYWSRYVSPPQTIICLNKLYMQFLTWNINVMPHKTMVCITYPCPILDIWHKLIIIMGTICYNYILQRRHDGRDHVSNHQPRDCLLNRLSRRRSKSTPKLRVTGLCEGNSPATGEFPAQRVSNAENVSIWWRHHYMPLFPCTMSNRERRIFHRQFLPITHNKRTMIHPRCHKNIFGRPIVAKECANVLHQVTVINTLRPRKNGHNCKTFSNAFSFTKRFYFCTKFIVICILWSN